MSDMDALSEFIAESMSRQMDASKLLGVAKVQMVRTMSGTFDEGLGDVRAVFQNLEDFWVTQDVWSKAHELAVRHAESGKSYDDFFQTLPNFLLEAIESSASPEWSVREARKILDLAKEIQS